MQTRPDAGARKEPPRSCRPLAATHTEHTVRFVTGPSADIVASFEGDGEVSAPRTVRFDIALLAQTLGGLQRAPSPQRAARHDTTLELGRHLFEAVLGARRRGLTADAAGPRRRLCFAIDPADARLRWLLSLPWELLFDDATSTFCGLESSLSIVRTLAPRGVAPAAIDDLGLEKAAVGSAGSPLRLLVAVASPRSLPPLDAHRLLASLRGHAATGTIAIDVLEHADVESLRRRLDQGRPHAVHLVTHAQLDAYGAQSALLLEAATGAIDPVDSARLESLWPPSLRLVTIDAAAGRCGASDPMAAVAAAIALQRSPTVVSLQQRLSRPAALTFGHELYSALAEGETAECAVQRGRLAIASTPGTRGSEWAAPVLYRNR